VFILRHSADSCQPVSKRRIALLKSLDKIPEAIIALNQFLDSSPTDAEAWAELSDLYVSQGLYQQAIFALEEVLLVTPYAWNVSTIVITDYKPNLTTNIDPREAWRDSIHGGYHWRVRSRQVSC